MWQLNCLALSTVISLGTPKRHIMFCQKNLSSPAAAMLTRGFTSIHFVKYSTHHHCILIVSLCCCQWSYYVDAPYLQWPQRCKELGRLRVCLSIRRELFTCLVGFDELRCIINYGRPIETLLEHFHGESSCSYVTSAYTRMCFG
jgi:hypothetical protein